MEGPKKRAHDVDGKETVVRHKAIAISCIVTELTLFVSHCFQALYFSIVTKYFSCDQHIQISFHKYFSLCGLEMLGWIHILCSTQIMIKALLSCYD